MELFDSHIHLQHLDFTRGVPQSTTDPIANCVVPAITVAEWQPLLDRYTSAPMVWLALGVHPQHAAKWSSAAKLQLQQLLPHPKVVAVGEIGLNKNHPTEWQQLALTEQIQLALAADKPLILHCYKRYGELLQILQHTDAAQVGGIVHGFSGSIEVALQLWQMGFAVGIGRTILNDTAHRLRKTVTALPDAAYTLETDAPWPEWILPEQRGNNAGADALPQIAQQVAALRQQTLDRVASNSAENTRRILHLDAF